MRAIGTSAGGAAPAAAAALAARPPAPRRLAARHVRALASSSSSPASGDGSGMPFDEYTPDANAAYWSRRPHLVAARAARVAAAAAALLAAPPAARPPRLRAALVALGPAYVKVGQAVSARPDVIPPEYAAELEALQDRIPPFSDAAAHAVIEEELRAPLGAVFSHLSPRAVAAASLGQVYRGRLRSGGGDVAVKVQRPGVGRAIALDVFILRAAAGAARRAARLNSDLPALLDEWAASLFRELDYRREAANGARFAALYGGLPGVRVPRMHADLTTRRVLVMEWVDGARLRSKYEVDEDDARGDGAGGGDAGTGGGAAGAAARRAEDLRLVSVGVQCSLEQMLGAGFFHADPHPGNLLRTRDAPQRLAYLDFGMVGEVTPRVRAALVRATLHLVNREYRALAADLVDLGMLPANTPGGDASEVADALAGVFAGAVARSGGVGRLSFGDLSASLGRTMYRFQFRVPAYFTLLVRSLSVLEGIALVADPNYKVLDAAYPWVARRLLTEPSGDLRAALRTVLYRAGGRLDFGRAETLLTAAARAPAGGGGAAGGAGSPLSLLLSKEGEFMRGIVVRELAVGVDAALRLAADAALADAAARAPRLAPGAGALAELLARAPRLAGAEDREQVEGIAGLVAAVRAASGGAAAGGPARPLQRGGHAGGGGGGGGDPFGPLADSLQSASDIIGWLAAEAQRLPPAQREELARLPLEIGAEVSSRLAARLLRLVVVGDAGAAGAAAGAAAAR